MAIALFQISDNSNRSSRVTQTVYLLYWYESDKGSWTGIGKLKLLAYQEQIS